MADLSPAQKVEVARVFILQAPPGEVDEVVKDVTVLVGADAGLQDKLPDILREYNESNNTVLRSADGASVVITKAGQVAPNKYQDPASDKVFVVDHVTAQISGGEPLAPDAATAELRAPTQEALEKYVKSSLAAGSCTVVPTGSGKLHIAVVTTKLNPRNLWNGRWRSSWEVGTGGGSAEMTGRVVAEVHYYEEGNVQLCAEKEVKATVAWGSAAEYAAAVVKTVREAEGELQRFLDDSYRSMSDTSFKALRRKMPLTQQRFQWNKLTAYSLAQELTSK